MLFKKGSIDNIVIKDFLSSSAWSIIGTLIAKFLLFFVWIVVARILSPEVYGEFSIIRSTTLLFADFVGFSFAIAATKYIAQYSTYDKEKLEKLIGLFYMLSYLFGIIFLLLLFSFADDIANSFMKNQDLGKYLKWTSVIMFSSILNNCQLGILRGLNKYKTIAKIITIQLLCSFPIFITLTYQFGLDGTVIAYILYNVIICILSHLVIKKFCISNNITPKFIGLMSDFRRVIVYILPYVFAMLATTFCQWYNETRLVSIGQNGFQQMGLFSAANVIQVTAISFAIMVCSPIVPIMTKYKTMGHNTYGIEQLNILLPLYISLLVSIPLILFPEIMTIIYGSEYANEEMYFVTVIMATYTTLIIYKQALSRSVAVYELQWIHLLDSIVLGICFILLFHFLKYMGAKGLVLTFLISYIISVIIFTPIYHKKGIIPKGVFRDMLLGCLLLSNMLAVLSYFIFDQMIIYRIIACAIIVVILCVSLMFSIKKYAHA